MERLALALALEPGPELELGLGLEPGLGLGLVEALGNPRRVRVVLRVRRLAATDNLGKEAPAPAELWRTYGPAWQTHAAPPL